MGVVLTATFRAGADARGVRAAREQAQVIATSTLEPALGGRAVTQPVDTATRTAVAQVARRLQTQGQVLRLRLRTPTGEVAYASDDAGRTAGGAAVDDEALEAAHGEAQAHLTRLNEDDGDSGAPGLRAVEVYLPLGDP